MLHVYPHAGRSASDGSPDKVAPKPKAGAAPV